MSRNVVKDINKNLSSKYSQKRFDHAKQSKQSANLTGNKIADKITKVSKN